MRLYCGVLCDRTVTFVDDWVYMAGGERPYAKDLGITNLDESEGSGPWRALLLQAGLEGTSWAVETELSCAVVNRTARGGGDGSEAGAATQAILMTLSRIAKRRRHDDIALFADLLGAAKSVSHPLLLAPVN